MTKFHFKLWKNKISKKIKYRALFQWPVQLLPICGLRGQAELPEPDQNLHAADEEGAHFVAARIYSLHASGSGGSKQRDPQESGRYSSEN